MLPSEQQLLELPLSEIEHLLHNCFPGSDQWNAVWPIYESKKRRADAKRTYFCFSVSTTLAIAALVRTFFPALQNRPAPPSAANAAPQTKSQPKKDPLNLFDTNPALEDCLKAVNSNDPLVVRTNDAKDDRKLQACIAQYGKTPR